MEQGTFRYSTGMTLHVNFYSATKQHICNDVGDLIVLAITTKRSYPSKGDDVEGVVTTVYGAQEVLVVAVRAREKLHLVRTWVSPK